MEKKKVPESVRKYFSDMGKKGGPAASRARWQGVSDADKSQHMRELVKARWKDRKAAELDKLAQ